MTHDPSDLLFFYDTETTGFTKPQGDLAEQPYLVQLAILTYSGDGTELSAYETIIKPDGWIVPDRVAEIHGISTERAEAEGIPLADAIKEFDRLATGCTTFIAHNIAFDRVVMAAARARAGVTVPGEKHIHLTGTERCTMRASTNICKIPKARGAGYKWPKLAEIHMHLFNEGFADAHSAMADTRAMARCYFELVKLDAFNLQDDADAISE